jgi:hypothetical protein
MNAAQQQQAKPGQANPETNLSLNEMLRVMDVAREMRNNRETAERVLARDDARAELRQKLMRSAQVSGDRVTEAEIDAAIDTYFADRHRYQDPGLSFNVLLAHAWVRRRVLLGWAAAGLIAVASVWGLFFSSFAPLSPSRSAARAAAAVQADANQWVDQIRAVALEPDAVARAERLAGEIAAAGSKDPTTAIAVTNELRELHAMLTTSYTLRIARDADGANLAIRNIDQEGTPVSGYFVFVEAVDSQGNVIPQRIRNMETGQEKSVKIWAERIPEAVFERLRIDKQTDGVLNESQFGKKERGRQEVELTMPSANADGSAIDRSIQITEW